MSRRWLTGIALMLLAVTSTASAQATYEWSDVDCVKSRIVAAPAATCRATNLYTGRDAAGGSGRRHLVRSDTPQAYSLIAMSEAIGDGAYVATRMATTDYLKATDKRASDGSDWTLVAMYGGIEAYSFRSAEGEACAGFRKLGEARGTGHAWLMHGLLCVPKGQPLPPAEISRFIESARIQ